MSDAGNQLARTRLAIIEHVQRKRDGANAGSDNDSGAPTARRHAADAGPGRHPASGSAAATRSHGAGRSPWGHGRFSTLADAGREYWRQHPLRLLAELATPFLGSYARRRPARFLALSAGAGALLLLARPWKLISVTGLVVAALRSPQLSSMVLTSIAGNSVPPGDHPPPD